MGCFKKILSNPVTQPLLDIAAVATGNPELIPIINAGATKLGGGSWGDAAKSGALSFAGQEALPVLGNAFSSIAPETAASLGVGGGANSLTDLLGQTSGGNGSLLGAGTIGGDIEGITSGGASGNSTMLSRLLSGSGLSSAASSGSSSALPWLSNSGSSATGFTPGSPLSISSPSSSGVGTGSGLTGDFAKGIAGNSPSFSNLTAPGASAGISGGGSSYGISPMNTISTLLGGASSLNANSKAQKALLDSQTQSMNVLKPFVASGTAANSKLSDLLGTSSNTSAAGYGSLDKPFDPGDLTQDPGYQFNLQQGNQALDRKNAASGSYFSGGALKEAQQFGQGLADNTYNNAFQRDQAAKGQTYGMISGQAGAGQNAANSAGNIYTNVGNARANAGISSSNILNQTLSSLLSGSGAKRPINIGGQVVYV